MLPRPGLSACVTEGADQQDTVVLADQVERQRIIDFAHQYPLEGYRRLTFMMLDRDLVAVSPSTTYRVLRPENCAVH